MLPDEILTRMMRRTFDDIDEAVISQWRREHRACVAALRATRPMPGSVRRFGNRRGLVTAVTVDAVWMVDGRGQFRIA